MRSRMRGVFIWMFPLIAGIASREEWIDPHDMNIKGTHRLKSAIGEPNIIYKGNCPDESIENTSYLQRVISLILDSASFDRSDPNNYVGLLNIHLQKQDYDFLKRFSKVDHINHQLLRELGTVLDNSFTKSSFEEYKIYLFTFGDHIYYMMFSPVTGLLLCVVFILFTLWKIQPQNFTFKTIMKLIGLLFYFTDFGLRYQQLLEVEEINKIVNLKSYNPEKCDPAKISWFLYIVDKLSGVCSEEYKEHLVSTHMSAMYIITPLKVLSKQFEYFVEPMKYFGQGLGAFMNSILDSTPWYLLPFMGIAALLLTGMMLAMLGSCIFGISTKWNLFHLIQWEIKQNVQNTENQDVFSRKDLKLLLDHIDPTVRVQTLNDSPKTSLPPLKEYKETHNVLAEECNTQGEGESHNTKTKQMGVKND